jgi:hypothetical protein
MHLEAVTFGDINRLLINVPPGFMKSLLVNVFWPAWEWGPMGLAHVKTCNAAVRHKNRGIAEDGLFGVVSD